MEEKPGSESGAVDNENLALKNKFMSIKVRQQEYMAVPTIAVYMSDKTNEVKENLMRVKHREQQLRSKTSESYTATISHEMRTPLETILFFLAYVINTLKTLETRQKAQLAQILTYCELIKSQLTFC